MASGYDGPLESEYRPGPVPVDETPSADAVALVVTGQVSTMAGKEPE